MTIYEVTSGISAESTRAIFIAMFVTFFFITIFIIAWKDLKGTEGCPGSPDKALNTMVVGSVVFLFFLGITLIF